MFKYYIPDCFWPVKDQGDYVSHEAVCVLNTNETEVTVTLTLYFEDRDKIDGIKVSVGAERTNHIRLDHLTLDGQPLIPRGVPYAIVVSCDKEITVQYTRVDTTQPALTIATTIAGVQK